MKLRVKIPLIYTILVASIGVAFILFTSTIVENHMHKEEANHFKSLSKSFAMNSANAIVLKDYAALRVFVDNTSKGENVSYAIILDENNSVLSHSQHALEGKILEDPVSLRSAASDDILMQAIGFDIMDVTAPLMIAGKKWGAVRVGFSLREMNSKVAKTTLLILFAGLITIFLGGAAAIFIAKGITDPIHKLHKGTEIIGEGNLDYRVDISTGDEIEQLATAFNTMTGRVQRDYLSIERAKKEWEATFDAISDPLFIHDREFKIIRCNRAYAEAAGMSFIEIIGKLYYEVFPKMEGPMKGCLKHLEASEESEEEFSLPAIGKIYNTRFYIVKDTDGEYLYSLHIQRDITEHKQMEAAQRESEQRFRAIFDNATDGILLADIEDKRFYTGNRMICQMMGYSLEEINELGVMDIHPEENLPYVIEQFKKQAGKEFTMSKNIPVRRKDGSIFYADINSSPIVLAGKTYLMGIFRDITETKKADEELHELFVGALTSLSAAIEAKSPWTRGHSERVTEYAIKIGREMGLSEDDLEKLKIAGLLHDIGKIGIYDDILDKAGKLTDEEYEMVKRHPGKGVEMLSPINQLKHIIPWIKGHHERYDMMGKAIPMALRVRGYRFRRGYWQ